MKTILETTFIIGMAQGQFDTWQICADEDNFSILSLEGFLWLHANLCLINDFPV
jgi:hypothetical protein